MWMSRFEICNFKSEIPDMTSSQNTVGLIGIGLLGSAIAERLLDAGCDVRGFDVSQERRNWLEAKGGHGCPDAAQLLGNCETVLLSLPDSQVVQQVLSQHRAFLRERQSVIDTTTGDPDQMIAVSRFLGELGTAYIEATVAGSSEQLRAGKATLFVGGDDLAVARVEPVLSAIAPNRFHLGPVGSASRFKLVHNLILGLNRAALAEGLAFAESLGIGAGRALDVLRQTPAASGVMATKGPKMTTRNYAPQARLAQHLKDVRLILAAAGDHGLDTPLSDAHRRLLEEAVSLGWGEADNSAVIEVYRERRKEGP